MGTISKTYTFSAGAVITASEHNTNFDTLYDEINGSLDNDNIDASAGIVDTKLAAITTAGKVNASALAVTSQAQGDVLYRSDTAWTRLAAGTYGELLQTLGTGANPRWTSYGVDIFPSGTIIQSVISTSSAVGTTNRLIPVDDTIPVAGSEGGYFLIQSFTPKASGNTLHIQATCALSTNQSNDVQAYLAVNGTTIAVSGQCKSAGDDYIQTIPILASYTTTGTDAISIQLAGGSYAAATITFNGAAGSSLYSTACKSSILTQEIKA